MGCILNIEWKIKQLQLLYFFDMTPNLAVNLAQVYILRNKNSTPLDCVSGGVNCVFLWITYRKYARQVYHYSEISTIMVTKSADKSRNLPASHKICQQVTDFASKSRILPDGNKNRRCLIVLTMTVNWHKRI